MGGAFENIVVDMRNNNIQNLTKSMEMLEKKNATIFNSIRKLYLTNNKINSVGQRFPRQLNTLHLDSNQLQYLSNKTIQIFKEKAENSNFSLKLSSNPFSCDCSSAVVVSFVKLHYSHVDDYKNVSMMCIDGEKELFHQSEEDFCPETLLFTLVTPAIIIGVLFCILLTINICYKETIMIIYFPNLGARSSSVRTQLIRKNLMMLFSVTPITMQHSLKRLCSLVLNLRKTLKTFNTSV